MCYTFPGPRCSRHATQRLERREARLQAVRAAHRQLVDSGASQIVLEKSAAKVFAALAKVKQAQEEFDETGAGQKQLTEIAEAMRANGDAHSNLNARRIDERREVAAARRAAKYAVYQQNLATQEAAAKEAEASQAKAAQHLHNAAEAERRAQESWERSDTDGAVTQWAAGMTGQLERAKAEIASNGGTAEFMALFDKEGNLVPAKNVRTRYGQAWGLLSDPANPRSSFSGWVNESSASTPEKCAAALEKKGYRLGKVRVPAAAKLDAPDGARGLGGALSVFVNVYRKDGGYSPDAVIVNNGI